MNPVLCSLVLLLVSGCLAEDISDKYNLLRRNRRAACPQAYSDISPNHSMCLTDKGTEVVLTPAEQQAIVDQHNGLRAVSGQPKATNMQKIVWDAEIAKVASKWVRQCGRVANAHESNPSYRSVITLPGVPIGQNAANGYPNFEDAVQAWYDEVKDFRYGKGATVGGAVIGHYTQVVNANVARIGCGKADCGGTPYYVCDYAKAQLSTEMQEPYATGNGDQCPNHRDSTKTLCDCGGLVCLNGAEIDLTKCTCKCTKLYEGKDCSQLKCPAEDGPFCGTQWPVDFCTKYTNVPEDCPYMCSKCKTDKCASGAIPFCNYIRVQPSQCNNALQSICPKKCGLCPGAACNGMTCPSGEYLNKVECKCIPLNVDCTKPDNAACIVFFNGLYPLDFCFSQTGAGLCPSSCGHCAAPPCTKNCKNGGTLDIQTCSCQCGNRFSGRECDFDKCARGDDLFCNSFNYTKVTCPTSFKPLCPNLCGVCPPKCAGITCQLGEMLYESNCTCINMGDCNNNNNQDQPLCDLLVQGTTGIQSKCLELPSTVFCPHKCNACN